MNEIIKWKVVHWNNISGKLWFRTVNIDLKKWEIEDWVYKINIKIKSKIYHWIWTYLERNETFESHIFDFNKNIYWSFVEIVLLKKIRNNKKFDNKESLIKQIKKDIKEVKKDKNYVVTFWTFDILHPWHNYYLNTAKFYSDKLVTIVATDNNVKKFKWHFPINNSSTRLENLKKLKIADITMVWEEKSPMKIIELYNPSIICLWYDQIWFTSTLEKYISENKLNTSIIRIPPFKEDIFKSSIIKEKMVEVKSL